MLIQVHGLPILRAILCGFAGVVPRTQTKDHGILDMIVKEINDNGK